MKADDRCRIARGRSRKYSRLTDGVGIESGMKILFLSNGHGEDGIAVQVLQALRHQDSELELCALPIVGEGNAYRKAEVPIISPVKTLPSILCCG